MHDQAVDGICHQVRTAPLSHDQLRQNEDGLRQHLSVVEAIALPVWVFDVDQCRVLWANTAGLELWEADSLDELRRRDMSGDISPTVKSRLEQYREGFEQGQAFTEIWTLYPKGKPKTIRCIFSGIRFDDGRMGMFNQSLEVLDQKESAESLRSIQALLHTSVMISLYDRDDRLLYSNPAARQAYKDADDTFRERLVDPDHHASMIASVTADGEAKCIARVWTPNGIRWHEVVARSGWDPVTGVPAILVSEVDVTAREEATQQISFLADHDMLTKLPNRRHLEREIVPMLAAAHAEAQQLGLLFIDIDRFKTINDTLGHAIGDQLLIDVANHLKGCVQPGDIVARMGGDEFIVVLNGLSGHADVLRFAEHLSKKLNRSITIDHHDISVTVSIGVSMFPRDGDSFEALLRYADMAMYSAKEDGRNTTRIFTSALESRLRLKVDLEASIRRGLLDDEFFLLYQPRPRVADNQVESAEALLRWNHPTEGVLGAETFIPLAEESGAIEALDAWVLLRAAEQQAAWHRDGVEIGVSVNVSPRQFRSERFSSALGELARSDRYRAGSIELELTESVLMGDTDEIRACLHHVSDLGFKLAIDDFGTGYSNFAYLRDYPINSLKIDRSFMQDLGPGCIVEGMMALCRILGVRIVAEGIEERCQLDWLKDQACDEYQGFFFCPPVPAVDMPDIVRPATLEDALAPMRLSAQQARFG
jgi:diguanylate cyclase (GGDEF)-like protein